MRDAYRLLQMMISVVVFFRLFRVILRAIPETKMDYGYLKEDFTERCIKME